MAGGQLGDFSIFRPWCFGGVKFVTNKIWLGIWSLAIEYITLLTSFSLKLFSISILVLYWEFALFQFFKRDHMTFKSLVNVPGYMLNKQWRVI